MVTNLSLYTFIKLVMEHVLIQNTREKEVLELSNP